MNTAPFSIRGPVAVRLGDNIDTDIIYPGRYLNVTDREQTPAHLFELAYPELRQKIKPGAILVGGKNFGCGSSREQATAAIKFAGVGAVIAVSFARIFFRNSINLGLPAVVSPEAPEHLQEGDEVEIDLATGRILKVAPQESFRAAALDPRAAALLAAGGLIPYLKKKYAA